MASLTPTEAKGVTVAERATPFRNHDDDADRVDSGGNYSHNEREFSATEADEWSSFMLLMLNRVLKGGTIGLPVYNSSGGTISKGNLVYVTSWNTSQDAWGIALSDADDFTKPAQFVATADISNNSAGFVYASATVTDLNTSAYSEGNVLYMASATVDSAGAYTSTDPSILVPTYRHQRVGVVSIVDASAGAIQFALPGLFLQESQNYDFISVPLTQLRKVDVAPAPDNTFNLANHGGILAQDSDPSLQLVNGDTDGQMYVVWDTANDQEEVTFQVSFPPDLDDAHDIRIEFRAKMSGTVGPDQPVIDLDIYMGEGDTKLSAATAAITSTIANVTVNVAAADVPANVRTMAIEMTPGVHTNDALYLYSIGVFYRRKQG